MRKRERLKKIKIFIDYLYFVFKILPISFSKLLLKTSRNWDGNLGFLIRYLSVKRLSKSCGENVAIFPGVYLLRLDEFEIGNNVSIHPMCYIDAVGGLKIGNDVSIAHNSTILSEEHEYKDMSKNIKDQGCIYKKTIIEDNVWIGAGVRILAGAHISYGNIIAAGAVLKNKTEKNSIFAGVPAKKIKSRGIEL